MTTADTFRSLPVSNHCGRPPNGSRPKGGKAMNRELYRYNFAATVPLGDVEKSLLLAVLATESLHGRSLVRLDASFCLDNDKRSWRGGRGDRSGPGHCPHLHRFYHPRVRREGLQGRTDRGGSPDNCRHERQGSRVMGKPAISTYSMWSLFRNCRKAFEWRYLEELVPLERDRNLALGTVIHQCLEVWHSTRQLEAVLDTIDRAYPNRDQDADQKRDWHLATAMMRGYGARYADEKFEVVAAREDVRREDRQSGDRRLIPQLHAGREGRWRRPHRRRALPAGTQDRFSAGRGLSRAAVDRLSDRPLFPLYRADPGHTARRRPLQRAGQSAPGTGARRDRSRV